MTRLVSEALYFLLQYFLLFSLGTLVGWIIELFWRRFVSDSKRWINPGFLQGPWLPLYGFGTILLFLLSSLDIPIYLLALIFLIGLTLLEYVAGIIFVNHFKIKLWDYSRNWGNIKGLICPLYSILWTLLGLFFYFILFPFLNGIIDQLYNFLQFSFLIGLYAGIFAVDLWQSFNIAGWIKAFVNETEEQWFVDFEAFKLELRDWVREGFKNRTHFFFPFRGELGLTFREALKNHVAHRKGKRKSK
jgi:uncharacterized membrane protein